MILCFVTGTERFRAHCAFLRSFDRHPESQSDASMWFEDRSASTRWVKEYEIIEIADAMKEWYITLFDIWEGRSEALHKHSHVSKISFPSI